MPSSSSSGTQTATVTTEHTLANVTSAGNYVLAVNTANMVAGDELELWVKVKVLTGGSEALYMIASYAHAQAEPVKMSIPVPSLYSVTFILKQTAGTGRDFEWNIISL